MVSGPNKLPLGTAADAATLVQEAMNPGAEVPLANSIYILPEEAVIPAVPPGIPFPVNPNPVCNGGAKLLVPL